MSYVKCPDCGSVGRHHYANCKHSDQPRIETRGDYEIVHPAVPTPDRPEAPRPFLHEALDSLDRIQAEIDAEEAAEKSGDVKAAIADEAKAIVTGARRSAYGSPENNFERTARFWQAYFENTGRTVTITAADVSPMMRLMKEARLCETPDHRDSFVDLVGYALTGAEVNKVKSSA